MLKQQMTLFINYLSFFHISQTKHLKNLLNRLKDFDNEIEDNVNGNHVYSVDDVEETEPLRKFEYHETIETTDIESVTEKQLDSDSIQQFESNLSKPEENTVNITLTPDNSENTTIVNNSSNNSES